MRRLEITLRAALTALALAVCMSAISCGPDDASVAAPREQLVQTELRATQVRAVPAGVDDLAGLAVDGGGRLYLAGRTGVRVVDSDGAEVRRIATEEPVRAVAVDENGNVWLAMRTRVRAHGPDDEIVAEWGEEGEGPGQFSVITDVEVAGPDVYVADAGNRCVHRFDLTGDYITDIGRRDPESGSLGLLCPSPHLDCVVAPDGTLRINNPGLLRVESYNANGELLGTWGEAGMGPDHFCGCCNPTDIAIMADGRVVTTEKGIPRLKVYDGAGRMLAYVPPSAFSPETEGMDIAVGPDGLIYVADPPAGLVRIFRLDTGNLERI